MTDHSPSAESGEHGLFTLKDGRLKVPKGSRVYINGKRYRWWHRRIKTGVMYHVSVTRPTSPGSTAP